MYRPSAVVLGVMTLAIASSTATGGPAGYARLSWGTCDPQVSESGIPAATPRLLNLVLSASGVAVRNLGYDFEILVGPYYGGPGYIPYPDAWRFDDGGCQTSARIAYSATPAAADCPSLRGTNAVDLISLNWDPSRQWIGIRLATQYDPVVPDPAVRYTLWKITFDLSCVDLVAPVEPDSCAGRYTTMVIEPSHNVLAPTDGDEVIDFDYNYYGENRVMYWGWLDSVSTATASWGRVKGLYR